MGRLVQSWLGGAAVGIIVGLSAAFADRRRGAAKALVDQAAPQQSVPGPAVASPLRLTPMQWRAALLRTVKDFSADQITAVAAGVTFFCLLALFPALSAFVSLYGLFADVGQAQKQIGALEGLLPSGAVLVISDQLTRLVQTNHGKLGVTFVVSLLLSLWSSNAGVKAMMTGLNVAYEERERRSFLMLNLVSLAFTLGVTLFSVIAAAAVIAAPSLLASIGWGAASGLSVLRWPLLMILVIGLLSLLYRYGPSRRHDRWRWITPGALAAGVGWLGMSLLFSWYVAHFGSFNKTYGSLGAVVGFMTWIWLSVIVVLAGAELNSELEKPPSGAHAHRGATD